MDAAADDRAALAHCAESRGHQFAGRCKDDRCIERRGGRRVAVADPAAAELACERGGPGVAGPHEGKALASLVPGDLRHDVCRGAETIDPEPLRGAGHDQRAIADQACAEQRGGVDVVDARWQREAEALVGDGVLGVTAIDLVAREAGVVAKVLAPFAAVAAVPAGVTQPGNADPRARWRVRAGPAGIDDPDDLVPGHDRMADAGQFIVDDVQVGAADGARRHAHAQLARARVSATRARRACSRPRGSVSVIASMRE